MPSDDTDKARSTRRPASAPGAVPAPHVRLLGRLTITRAGEELALPASRKVRALLAYLALARGPVARSPLCELLWDVPNDPRGELRWCLSKIRGVFDDAGRARVHTQDDGVRLDLADCFVDALDVLRASEEKIESLGLDRLRTLAGHFAGDLLEGLEIDRAPLFNGWLVAQRRRLRGCHAAILEHIVRRVPDEEALAPLERWLALAPFDMRVHETLLQTLARTGRIREGEEHLAAALKLFEGEGLDGGPLHQAWRATRTPLVVAGTSLPVEQETPRPSAAASNRASIAVMPFADHAAVVPGRGSLGGALAHDVIARLAKLRAMFVIAQGTVFALNERRIGAEEAGRILNVDYVVSGDVRSRGERMTVSVELVETRTAHIVWAETYDQTSADALAILDAIGDRIVASIAAEIELHERNRAVLKAPGTLDAWEAYHRGLWHMYQYRKDDNDRARQFFEAALRQDPTFSRAHAGLSFTHFQDAFQNWAARETAIEHAHRSAAESLMADERDPAAHWAMGRALWLRARHEESLGALARSVELSPNFALGHYNLSFVHSIVGDPATAIDRSDHSRHLSPFDPMLFGMLGTRAMALARLGRFDEAAAYAVKAAGRPNAFPHIHAMAAIFLALAGDVPEGRQHAASARRIVPDYGLKDFFAAFPFQPESQAPLRRGAKLVGLG